MFPWEYDRFCQLSPQERWLWILGGGTFKQFQPQNSFDFIKPPETSFILGRSVKSGIDKTNSIQSFEAFWEFKEIEASLPSDCLKVFTDGSAKQHLCASAFVVYDSDSLIHQEAIPIGLQSIGYAELYAVMSFLRWFRVQNFPIDKQAHLFIDSQFVCNSLPKWQLPQKNFYIFEAIHNIASFLPQKFYLHWIPSHLRTFIQGKLFCIEGNQLADKLAQSATINISIDEEDSHDIDIARRKITEASANLISDIDLLISKNVGTPNSLDDFSLSDAIRDNSESEN